MAIESPGPDDTELNVGDTSNRIRERAYSIASEREKIRGRLAQILIIAIVVSPIVTLLLLIPGSIKTTDLPAVAGVTAPLAGIAGAAIGFYFGSDETR